MINLSKSTFNFNFFWDKREIILDITSWQQLKKTNGKTNFRKTN